MPGFDNFASVDRVATDTLSHGNESLALYHPAQTIVAIQSSIATSALMSKIP
ncbi:hypothetical protein D3C72_2417250 [compost metagenome]